MSKCERCGKKLDWKYYNEKEDKNYLADLHLNGLSVSLCKGCDRELVKWLGFSHEKLAEDYMIITREGT